MRISLEEARSLDAVARFGSLSRAAKMLGKTHSAVIYSIKSLEAQTGLGILDRSSYRSGLTPEGKRIWEQCGRLLSAEQDIARLCHEIKGGWEPFLRIVMDGVVPFEPVLKVLLKLSQENVPTQVRVVVEHLGGVEECFLQNEADLMISVLPPEQARLEAVRLCPVTMVLVAHRSHPLSRARGALRLDDLRAHPFLTIRGSDRRLNQSTSALEEGSIYRLSDFQAKKAAILHGLGFGWLPDYVIQSELRKGDLRQLRWDAPSVHTVFPHLYFRSAAIPGRARTAFIDALLALKRAPDCERCELV